MVQLCVVSGCKKESYPGCLESFHRLPDNEDLKKKWMEAMRISGNLSKYSVVCSLHFNDEDYITEAKKRLKPKAIPSILPKIFSPNTSITLITPDHAEPGTSGEPASKNIKLQADISTQTQVLSTPRTTKLRRNVKLLKQQLKRRDVKIEKLKHILNVLRNTMMRT